LYLVPPDTLYVIGQNAKCMQTRCTITTDVRNSIQTNLQIIRVIYSSETAPTVAKKFQRRLSNPNPIRQNLSNPNPIQIHHTFENPPDLNPNPCSSLVASGRLSSGVSPAIRVLFSNLTCFIAESVLSHTCVCVSKYQVHFWCEIFQFGKSIFAE